MADSLDDLCYTAWARNLEECPRCGHRSLEVRRRANPLDITVYCWCQDENPECECGLQS